MELSITLDLFLVTIQTILNEKHKISNYLYYNKHNIVNFEFH